MEWSPTLRRQMLPVVLAALFQARQTAFVNARFGIEIRLAHWCLMCHDRVAGTELLRTHEILAIILGVQRSGVTLAVQNLEGSGFIRARRGRITIRNRDRLQEAAGNEAAGSNDGVAEAAYRRLVEEGCGAAPPRAYVPGARPDSLGGVGGILGLHRFHVGEGWDIGAPGASASLRRARGVRLGAERANVEPEPRVAEDAASTAAESNLSILGNGSESCVV